MLEKFDKLLDSLGNTWEHWTSNLKKVRSWLPKVSAIFSQKSGQFVWFPSTPTSKNSEHPLGIILRIFFFFCQHQYIQTNKISPNFLVQVKKFRKKFGLIPIHDMVWTHYQGDMTRFAKNLFWLFIYFVVIWMALDFRKGFLKVSPQNFAHICTDSDPFQSEVMPNGYWYAKFQPAHPCAKRAVIVQS